MNRLFIVHCGNEPDNQTPPIWTDSYESAWHILAETTGEGVTKTELESHGYAIHEFVEAPDYDRGWLERMSEAIYECSKNPTCPVAFRRAMIVAEEKASWKDDRPKGEQKNPSAAEFNGVYQNWVHVLSLIAQTGERVLGEGFMERNGGAEDAPEQIMSGIEEMARKYRELVPKEPVDAEGATVDNGWFPMPPNDGSVHMRGLEVHDNATGHRHWEQYRGYIHEESGDFISEDDEDFGWRPDDYTHWKPLSPPPAAPGDKGE